MQLDAFKSNHVRMNLNIVSSQVSVVKSVSSDGDGPDANDRRSILHAAGRGANSLGRFGERAVERTGERPAVQAVGEACNNQRTAGAQYGTCMGGNRRPLHAQIVPGLCFSSSYGRWQTVARHSPRSLLPQQT